MNVISYKRTIELYFFTIFRLRDSSRFLVFLNGNRYFKYITKGNSCFPSNSGHLNFYHWTNSLRRINFLSLEQWSNGRTVFGGPATVNFKCLYILNFSCSDNDLCNKMCKKKYCCSQYDAVH